MIKQIISICIFLTAFFFNTSGQSIDQWIENNEKIPSEKIYLHTDSEFYFLNDTIWFKIYLIDSQSGKLIPGPENVYVNVLDKNGKSVLETILLSTNGQAFGQIPIPQTIYPGNFILQATTDYLQNFDNNAGFQKALSISRASASSNSRNNLKRTRSIIADVTFFPEGGNLLENVTNLVAFKAINQAGYGINTIGSVRDEKGNTLASFKTDYKGMGMFFLTPETGKTYHVKINGLPTYNYTFEPSKKSLKIQLVNHTSSEIILNIAGNSEQFIDQTYYLANMHRGNVLFYHSFIMEGLNQVLKFDSQILHPGVNRLVLLDKDLKPISERLLFSKTIELNELQTFTEKEYFNKKEKITLKVANSEKIGVNEVSNLSVSVVNKVGLESNIKTQNILSCLLIDSELNGFYDSSLDFLVDNEISSEVKLRLLMLTHGWSSYFWNSAPNKTGELLFTQKAGLNIRGTASNVLTGSAIENGEITLAIQKDGEHAFLSQKTNQTGEFDFSGLLFKDTATVYVQAKNDKGKMNTEIVLQSPFLNSESTASNLAVTNENLFVPSALQKIKYQQNILTRKQKKPIIKARNKSRNNTKSIVGDKHFRLYENADFVVEVKENEESFENILDFMVGKVPGLDISGNDVRIRGTSGFGSSATPLFLIDGVPLISNEAFILPDDLGEKTDQTNSISGTNEQLIQSVKSIPINDVDKIEILKSSQNLAAFGANGSNGVIAIYTRIGKRGTPTAMAKGVIEKQIAGYSSSRKFYSPIYSPGNKNDNDDYRTTLFWKPDLLVEKDTVDLQFFASDIPGTYAIFVEGITSEGKICLGTAEFEVTK